MDTRIPTKVVRKEQVEHAKKILGGQWFSLVGRQVLPRGKWPLGRVVEVMPSRDRLVRTLRVKTRCTVATRAKWQRKGEPLSEESMTVLTRPVTKLCLLELD